MDQELFHSYIGTKLFLFYCIITVSFRTVARVNLNLQRLAENKSDNCGFRTGSYLPAAFAHKKQKSGNDLWPLQVLRESAAMPVITMNLSSSKEMF